MDDPRRRGRAGAVGRIGGRSAHRGGGGPDGGNRGFVALLPIAAGLSVQRYRLYDIDRILSRTAAYLLSTAALTSIFVAVVAALGTTLGNLVDDSTIPAVVATIATVTSAAPLHRYLQGALDRRFDRRRFDARRMVAAHLRSPSPGSNLQSVIADALHDPSADLAYWITGQEQWVTAAGLSAEANPDDIVVQRDSEPVARLRYDSNVVDPALATELPTESLSELDNIRLRAAVALQLEEVRDSRARIVSA